MPLLASGELLGFVAARAGADGSFGEEARDLAISLTNQTADAIKKIQLIERLTERNQLKDFFEDLGRGAPDGLAARGRKLGVDLERAHLVLWAQRFDHHEVADIGEQLERLESAVGRALAGSVCDRRDGGLRILVPLGPGGEREALARLRATRTEVAPDVVVGVSSPCSGVEAYVTGFAEALQAVSAAPVVQEHAATVTFDDLGPYKYLLRVSQEGLVRDRHADALRSLLDYDRQRQAQLVRTLEEYLRQRGNVSATAQALYVHPNTLRQRLRRITELTELDVRTDDWLMIEIALKLLRLEDLLGVGERVATGSS
jgi:purine catabolism regulator